MAERRGGIALARHSLFLPVENGLYSRLGWLTPIRAVSALAALGSFCCAKSYRLGLGFAHLRRRTFGSHPSLSVKKNADKKICVFFTEREGFEPSVRFPAHLISSQAQSTTLSSLLVNKFSSQPIHLICTRSLGFAFAKSALFSPCG